MALITNLTVQNTWDSQTGKCTVCGVECDHKWKDATCEDPQTCTVCGKTEGSALGHNNNNTDSSNSNLNNRENDTTSGNTSTQTAPETGDSYMKFYIALSALFVSSAVLIFISLKRKAYQK